MKISYWLLLIPISLSGCGESAPPAQPKPGVFSGYVEDRNAAQDTAQAVQDAMQAQEKAIEQRRE
jgi:hypothetical protein